MAHWFHRNPLKATAPATFEMRGVATNGQAQKICSDARMARNAFLDAVSDPNNEVETVINAVNNYLSLLQGFIQSMDPSAGGDSKLRNAIRFRWTNSLCGNKPEEQHDCLFDAIGIIFNLGLWYTKHAAKLAGKEEPTMEEAKDVHKCLRSAAGSFKYIQDELIARLITTPEKGFDTDTRVLSAYIHVCTAEAQEVTIARAIELKHSSGIISSLAFETAKLFTNADDALNSIEDTSVNKWKKYLQFKVALYYAYAYNFHGDTILAEDKCGEAIKCLEESQKYYEKAGNLGKEYSTTKGPGTTAKPQEHLFYKKLGPIVKRTLDKCLRENGFIYHQKIPPVVPDLELKATYGLVAPEEFKIPEPNPLWTPDVYKAFDITKLPKPDEKEQKQQEKDKDKDLPPVKEADIPQSNKDPSNFSGCVVS